MNMFGRKTNKHTTPSITFTMGTRAAASASPTPPPTIAFRQQDVTESRQIELTTPQKTYQDTMKELHDFQIDSDDELDDIEFGDTIVNNATRHVERRQRKTKSIVWMIAGLMIVGVCVGIMAAVAGTNPTPRPTEQSLPPPPSFAVDEHLSMSNMTNATYGNMTDIGWNETDTP